MHFFKYLFCFFLFFSTYANSAVKYYLANQEGGYFTSIESACSAPLSASSMAARSF